MTSLLKHFSLKIMWLLIFYSICRVYFLIANWNIFKGFSLPDLAFAFVHGLRFDLSGIVLLNILFIFLYFLPKPKAFSGKPYKLFMMCLFYLTNCLFIIFNIADGEYYTFSGKRSSLDIFGFSQDINQQLGNILINFAPKVLFSIFLSYLFYRVTKKHFIGFPSSKGSLAKKGFTFVAVIFLIVVAARGGLQSKVLRPAHAFIIGNASLAHLSQNTTFTVLKSKLVNNLEQISFYKDAEVKANLSHQFSGAKSAAKIINPNGFKFNVVVIALEGFSTDYWGYGSNKKGYTPFLDQLAKRGVFFKNHFANGRRSAEAFPALFMGIPSLGRAPLPMSQYINNEIWGVAHGLKSVGYDSQFFHGANYNSSYTHSSAKISGFEKLISRDDYPDPKDYNGHWGISDGPFLKFFANKMDKLKEPFITGVLTLSSHEPFELPAEYEEKIPQLSPKILRTILYTDKQMELFFKLAKTKPWYRNTLFVITGDHTSQNEEFSKSTSGLGLFRVPMLFYTESDKIKLPVGAIKNKITQHADLPVTLLELARVQKYKIAKFGKFMFSKQKSGRAILRSSQIYRYVSEDYILKYFTHKTGREGFDVYKNNNFYEEGELLEVDTDKSLELKKEFKSLLQYYNNSMLQNSIYKW